MYLPTYLPTYTYRLSHYHRHTYNYYYTTINVIFNDDAPLLADICGTTTLAAFDTILENLLTVVSVCLSKYLWKTKKKKEKIIIIISY